MRYGAPTSGGGRHSRERAMSDMEQGPGTDRRAFLKKMAALGGGALAATTVMTFAFDGVASAGTRGYGGGSNAVLGGGSNGTIGGGSNATTGGRCDYGGGSNATLGGHDRDDDRDDDRKKGKSKGKGRR
jgi:hypothetical protein